MSTTAARARTKRAYHHGDLREALVDAGLELAREHGPRGVVVREAARRVGVSHNAAYRHFADRASLLTAIAEQAMGLLTAAMERRLAAIDARGLNPLGVAVEQVRATGRGYVDFAVGEPGLFRVLFSSFPEDPTIDDPRETGAATPLDVLTTALDGLDAAGGVAPGRRPIAETLCWSTVHGFAALHVDGPLRDVPAQHRDSELERVIDTVCTGLRTSPGNGPGT